jgi:hypothetical protein
MFDVRSAFFCYRKTQIENFQNSKFQVRYRNRHVANVHLLEVRKFLVFFCFFAYIFQKNYVALY